MAKRLYRCSQVSITYGAAMQLMQVKKLQMGIGEEDAAHISKSVELRPPNIGVSAAFAFWIYASFGLLIYSIYCSFTSHWWWFIPGLFMFSVMFSANKKANAENIIKTAWDDAEYYETLRQRGFWSYSMNESDAAPFLRPASEMN